MLKANSAANLGMLQILSQTETQSTEVKKNLSKERKHTKKRIWIHKWNNAKIYEWACMFFSAVFIYVMFYIYCANYCMFAPKDSLNFIIIVYNKTSILF